MATAELILQDEDGYQVYSTGEKAEETTHVIDVDKPLTGNTNLRVETSVPQPVDRSFIVKIKYVS